MYGKQLNLQKGVIIQLETSPEFDSTEFQLEKLIKVKNDLTKNRLHTIKNTFIGFEVKLKNFKI